MELREPAALPMPDSAKFIEKAEKLVQKGRLDEAVQEYLLALAEDPNNTAVVEIVAELYLRQGLSDKGQECYVYLFDRLREKGDKPKATLVFRKLLKIGPQEPAKMMEFAALLESSKPAEAATVYQGAAEVFRQARDMAGALEAIRRVAALDPNNADLQCLLAEASLEAGQNELAAAAFLRAADIQRRQPGGRGGAESILPLVERAHQVSGSDRSITLQLAGLLLEGGKPQRAVDLLQPLAGAPGVSPDMLRTLGEACLALGDATGAESALVLVASTHPDAPRLLTRAAQRYLELGQADLAVSLLERLKDALQNTGRQRDFVQRVEQIPEELSAKAPFLGFLSSLYSELGQDEKASRALARLFDLHFAERNFVPAADALDRLVHLDPYDSGARQRLQLLNGKLDARRWQALSAAFQDGASGMSSGGSSAASSASPRTADDSDPMIARRDWRDTFKESGQTDHEADGSAAPREAAGGDTEYEASILEDLMLQAEIFIQYGLKNKAVERLERVNKLFPGEEERNEKLRGLYSTAGVQVKAVVPGFKPVAESASEAEDIQVDFGRAGEITRNIFRQGTVKNVLFAAVNDVGRTWRVSKCVAAMCTPGKTPSALLEFCASGQKQSDAFNLVKLVQAAMKISGDGSPQAVEDAESSVKLQPFVTTVKALGVKSMLALPMMEGDGQIGVMILEQCDRRRKWRSSEVMVLKTVADQMVMAASHVKLRTLMKSLAVTDERTGMLMRGAYLDCLLAEVARWQQQGGEICVALAQFGRGVALVREAGEEAVRKFMDEAGLAINSHLRQNDVAIRYDSTTLALVMPGTKGSDGLQVMEKMRRIVSSAKLSERIPPFTYGVVEPVRDTETDAVDSVTELINRAEQALEEAHKAGGNTGKLLAAAI
jgi:diguanylate cyclase (GGDEF)-like protein